MQKLLISLVDSIPFAWYHCSPRLTCPKDGKKEANHIGRTFRNLRVEAADVFKFGIQWRDKSIVDIAVAFSWVYKSMVFQMISDAIFYILSK